MMLHHPEMQMKAQREIDSVTGRNRLPTIADMANLPYVKSLVVESLRLNPPAPLGMCATSEFFSE
jgi:cytochrome P450